MSSILKVNQIQDIGGNTIVSSDGSGNITLNVSNVIVWQSVQTTGFTAEAGKGYPCNTTSAAFTVTLPATPSAGDQVQLVDYAGTFDTKPLTIDPNGNKIEGATDNLVLINDREGVIITYIDSTQGWIGTSGFQEGTDGLSVTTYSIDFLVVGGGAGGGGSGAAGGGGGGGAGGYRTSTQTATIGTEITITVGSGGAGGAGSAGTGGVAGTSGGNSSISGAGLTTITSAGGGGGGSYTGSPTGIAGGSGGGGAVLGSGGAGNTPNTSPSQGNNGGNAADNPYPAGGGGGSSSVGSNGSGNTGGAGGNGTANSITGSSITRAGGGGGGGGTNGPDGANGTGGGSTPNLGGGNVGGTGSQTQAGFAGGSGVVILSVPTNRYRGTVTGSPTVTESGSNTIIQFNGDGSYVV